MLVDTERTALVGSDPKLDRDWLAVAASAVGLIFSVGTLTLAPVGVFMRPLGHEFGWTRGQISGAHAFGQPALIVSSLLWGALLDRFGARRTILPAIFGLGLSIASLSLLRNPIWHLSLMFALIPLVAGAANPVGYAGILVRRFNKRLGLALGLALMGIGLGAAFMPSLAQSLIDRFGWRTAYVVLGALTILISVPAAIIATRSAAGPVIPRDRGVEPSVLPLMLTRPFLLICLTFVLLSTASVGAVAHLVPMMTDKGFSPVEAARIAGLTGFATLVSRGVIGWMLDRIHAPYLLAVMSLLCAAACLLLAFGTGRLSPSLAAVILGLVAGSEVDFITFLIRKYFGPARFGRLYAVAFSAFILGPGGVLMGYSYDHFHQYRQGLLLFVGIAILAGITALFLPRYEQNSRVPDLA